jgi:dipeptidyl aminopeptidase/acylaminoacyl peptidase
MTHSRANGGRRSQPLPTQRKRVRLLTVFAPHWHPHYGRPVKRALPAAAVLLALAAHPAAAAVPGSNGPIAMERPSSVGGSIALVNADGTGARDGVVAVGPADRDPSWAPDGRRLAFMSNRDGNEEIYVLDTETGIQTRLTFNPAQDHDPTWSPDGTRIAFASDRDGNQEIYVIPAAGGPEQRLTVDPALERQPAWSSRGVIAFASDRTGDFDLYVMDDQGGGVTRLTQEPGADIDPSWAPDGSQIAYTHDNTAIYAIDATGQNRRLVTAGAYMHFPAWSPDGTRIAFALGGSIAVVPAAGGAALGVAFGTDPNWGPLPPPVGGPDLSRTVTLRPAGRVLVAPATSQPPATAPGLEAQLRSAVELPVGTTIDASQGGVAVDAVTTTPEGPNTVGHAFVSGGVFTIAQGPATGAEPTFELHAGSLPCGQARISRLPDPEYRIRVRARGRFRSVTGYGRAAGRGTDWITHNRCDGTIFKVYEGIVDVRDFRRRITVRVPAGRCYLAATRRRADALKPARTCPRARTPR